MFLLVSEFKITGMLLNVVHSQVQKSQQKHITKESYGFHNYSTLIFGINDYECCFEIVIRNFTSREARKFGTILGYHERYLCQISRTNHAVVCLHYSSQKVCNFHM